MVVDCAGASMGAVHVPVNFTLKGEELRHILRDADVALIAADPALLGLAEEAAADLTRERGAEALAVWPLLPAIRLIAKPDIPAMLELVEREHLSSLFLAPTVWVPLSSHPQLETRDLSSLTKAQYGASIMPSAVLQRLRDRFPRLGFCNCFGQSELGPLCTVLRPEEHDLRPTSCGRPVFHVEARVMTADGTPAGAGEPGEIQHRSPQLMSGCWGRPEQTEESFADGWFRSGDQVTRDSMGFIEVVDWIKDVINTGGVLVAPREIEDCLYRLPEVAEVAVPGLPDERWGEAITAVIVVHPDQQLTAETVRRHAREHQADYKVPQRVEFVAELPRNQSGKLLKREPRAQRTAPRD